MRNALATQPEPIAQQLKRGLLFYRTAFRYIFPLSLLLSLIVFIPRLIVLATGDPLFLSAAPLSPERLWFILIDFISLIFFTAILERIYRTETHKRGSTLSDIRIAFKKSPLIIVAALLQLILFMAVYASFMALVLHSKDILHLPWPWGILTLGLGFILPLVIWLFFYFLFYFYLPLIVVENKGVLGSLKKSASLVWGNWWRTFWVQVIPWLCYLLVLVLIKFVFSVSLHIYFVEPNLPNTFLGTVLHLLLFALFIPWVVSVMLVQLNDLELRKKSALS